MFKSSRWRSEKSNKIKIVFKLQFHATQVTQLKAEGLTISVVPGDVGKSTGKAEKAMVLDGHCRWESPVYETVKFLQDVKTGKVNQRIYHLVMSTTGSTKSGVVGETSIDFADYVDAIKTCNVSLPLQNSNSKAMLHVAIQRQLENADPQRVVKESDSLVKRSRGQDLKSHLSIEADESHKSDSQEEGPFGKASRITELRRRASIESDSTLSSFDSVSELDTLGEVEIRGDHIQQNHSTMHHHSVRNVYEEPHISESEWSGSSDQGISTDDSMNSSNDTIPRDTTRTSSDNEVDKLKAELGALARRTDLSELELQSLRKQIVKETKRSQDLLREVTSLKQERDLLKADNESNKASDKRKEEAKIRNKLQLEGRDPHVLLEETREELDYEKDLNSNLRLQLQKTQESNTELILAVQDLEAMEGQRTKKTVDLPGPRTCERNTEESRRMSCTSETDDDEDQKALDELVKGHMDAKEAHVLERRITDLYNEIEIYKRDKEDLEIQVEQLSLDYEILKQENHDISYKLEQSQVQEQLKMQYECSSSLVNVNELENHVESLEAKLKKQYKECSESLYRIKELETQIKGMEEELEKQAQIFEGDIEAVTRAKVEQEQRAIEAEEALRKTRWKNASVAGKIQDEFKRISEQMSSTLAANEKVTMKAMTETRELRMQKRQLEELLMNANDELRVNRVEYEAKLNELSGKTDLKTKEMKRMSADLEYQKRQKEDVNADLTHEITRRKDEIEILRLDLEETRKSSMETEASLSEELQRIIDEKEAVITALKSQLETAIAPCDNLKHSLSNNESEIENLRKQVVQVRSELEKKEEEMANLENREASADNITKTEQRSNEDRIKQLEGQIKLKENALEASSKIFIEKEKDLKNRIEELQTKLNETDETLQGPEAIAMQYTEVLPLSKSDNLQDLVNEVASLREQNGLMETELKEMQERYSEISLRFAEVEGERQQLVMTVRYLKNAKKR
ncbi:Myosin heavy chain-related protein [Arabidopsis thaliana]|uniref:Myosin heavy chain-related protein n=1 Tax=Arabidopsis thaliana TaxID=3702 RepID=F4JWY3_ARATH|nr:Myosin heavy chain-related protein [Arabidopsis thaliana]AED94646.1 Myosin heavy chain-related protein [Arabidopsis thaliana]|eukprot:NP_001190446.1 Myosin heavy chain-related protein [Arabidopsis thaliana]